ncbi:MAG TPA: hypothetical protein PK459_02805 [Anaerolineaceae bacterium]|mgnify:FL=1|jgi:hypothetical protein|nr:hypothetical protein [Anaerolineaceae bacterium]HNZ14915.1 hypothetical protein [Anaerolineaceae bacterium]HOH91846.1 hypothetical protein [Anaerolineaceae bacterium]HPX65410.1 hypothetical protein [Anaerolineaceae bacterium]HQC64011.1 hypothetical protein [Anaerolineaceae bacterium]
MLRTGHFMRPPEDDQIYNIGDRVEVNCDHEDEEGQRIRGWVRGTVVQVENKLIAVQFKNQKIYLTDGWMVPDNILWFPFDSENVRPWVSPQSRARK